MWINKWKYELPYYEEEQSTRVVIHTVRKTFCNLLYRVGWDMVRISCYGDWSVPTSLTFYYQYMPHEALQIAKLLFNTSEITDRANIVCDLDALHDIKH